MVLAEQARHVGRHVRSVHAGGDADAVAVGDADGDADAEADGEGEASSGLASSSVDADTVGERLKACMDFGVDGLTINLPGNGHNTDRIGLLGEIALAATA